jgi:two-component system chemotaxis response regulator CheY
MALADKLQVMVVDDTSVSRALVTDALDQMGVRHVTIARDGAQALKALMAQPVHLVISDMYMPGLDGLALLKGLRGYKPTQRIGFILVTGSGDKTLIEKGKQFQLNNFVTKPFTTASLKAAIEAVVGRLSWPTLPAQSKGSISFRANFMSPEAKTWL